MSATNSPGTCSCMNPSDSPAASSSCTSSAPGCHTRTRTPSSISCGPRKAKGSPCSARSRACTCALSSLVRPGPVFLSAIAVLSIRVLQGLADLDQSAQRDVQPVRPVTGFVIDFIGRLFQAEQRQCRLLASAVTPGVGHPTAGLTVGVDKGPAALLAVAPGNQQPRLLGFFRMIGAVYAAQGGGGGVVEGTQQAGDILERAVTLATLLQWPGGFTFKIDETGVAGHHQHLPEVQIAMDPDPYAAFAPLRQPCHL